MKRLLSVIFIASSLTGYAQVVEYPVFDRTDESRFHIDKIVINSDTTYVHCTYHAEYDTWANISPQTYLESLPDGKRFPILKSEGLPFAPNKRDVKSDEDYYVILKFQSVRGSKRFNYIETPNKEAFNVYGVSLSDGYDKSYKKYEYKRFQSMSDFYRSASDNVKYLDLKNKELDAACYLFGTKSMEASLCYQQLSIYYSETGDYTKAIQYGLQELVCDSIHFGVNNKEYPVYATTLRSLAGFYEDANDTEKAIMYYNEAADLYKKLLGVDDDNYSICRYLLSCIYQKIDSIEKAVSIMQEVVDLRIKNLGEEHPYTLMSMNNLAGYNSKLGNYHDAIDLGEKIVSIEKAERGETENYSLWLHNLSSYYSHLNDWDKAITLEKRVAKVRSSLYGNESLDYFSSLSSLANYYFLSGDYNNAVKYEEESIKLYSSLEGKDNVEYPEQLSVLVDYLQKNGSYQKMIEYQKEITELYFKLYGKDTQHYAQSLAFLSKIYSEIGDYSNAIEASEKGLEVYRDSAEKKDINYIYALSNLSNLYYAKYLFNGEDKYKSLNIKEEVVNLAAEHYGKNNISYAKCLSDFALHYFYINGCDEKVEKCIQEVKRIYDNDNNKYDSDCSVLLINLSNCLSILGDNNSAIRYSMELLKQLDEYDSTYSTCLDDIAKYYANMKDYPKAVEYVSLSLRSIRKMINNTNDNQDVYRHYLYWTATNLLDKLVNYVSRNPTDSAVSILYDEAINTRTLRVNKGLGKWCSWKDIQSHLEENEIAIEFIHSIGDSVINIYSLLLKKDQAYPKMIKISSDNEINDSLRCATSNNDKDYKLGQIVWGRLANELFGINKIFFSPTWAFLAIPIEYFPVNEKHYFNDIYNMYRLSSTRELVEREIDDDHFSNAYLYGGLSYEDTNDGRKANIRSGFEPLFNTKIEIDEISTILKKNGVNTVELTGNNGTEQSIKDLSNTDVEILHIATHGDYRDKETEIVNSYGSSMIYQYSPNEDVHANSFLVMSGANRHLNNGEPLNYEEDGLLTANEISKLDLHKIKILVLSACETGRGNYGTDDMMWGVQRGFKEAGVKSILMSLRKVDDEATRILMVEFYKNLMSGKTKHQSLKDAQKHLRQVENGKYDKPEYWASFIMLDGL